MDRNGSGAKLANGAVLQMYGPCNDSCSAQARSIEKRMSQESVRVSAGIRIDNLRVAEPTQTTCWIDARTDRARQATID